MGVMRGPIFCQPFFFSVFQSLLAHAYTNTIKSWSVLRVSRTLQLTNEGLTTFLPLFAGQIQPLEIRSHFNTISSLSADGLRFSNQGTYSTLPKPVHHIMDLSGGKFRLWQPYFHRKLPWWWWHKRIPLKTCSETALKIVRKKVVSLEAQMRTKEAEIAVPRRSEKQKCSEIALKMLWFCSKTDLKLKLLWNCSEIALKLIKDWNCSEIALKLLWYCP